MIVDWQYEPIKDRLIHIDLKPHCDGQGQEGPGSDHAGWYLRWASRWAGGILDQVLREVEVECLPARYSCSHIDLDVTNLAFGDVRRCVSPIFPTAASSSPSTTRMRPIAHVVSGSRLRSSRASDAVAATLRRLNRKSPRRASRTRLPRLPQLPRLLLRLAIRRRRRSKPWRTLRNRSARQPSPSDTQPGNRSGKVLVVAFGEPRH